MRQSLFKGKSTRTKIFTAITIAAIVLIMALNILLAGVFERGLVFVDLTPEEFYTLSDTMVRYCSGILEPEGEEPKEIEITFCTDPDYLVESANLRATYFMALALQKKFDTVKVKTVNVVLNPTAVSMYKTTSRDDINPTDIIVTYGTKYRVANAENFWTKDMVSYNGEYRLASIMASLTAVDKPCAYFITDHGETYYDPADPTSEKSIASSALYDLLTERGLQVKTLSLSETDEIPDDCVLLIVNNPTEDFRVDESRLNEFGYISETEKIDRYLLRSSGALFFNKDYRITLPNIENLAREWGIAFGNAAVYDEENVLFTSEDDGEAVFAGVYDPAEENYGYAYYGSYATLSSSPKMVFTNTGYVYCGFKDGDALHESGNRQGMRNYAEFIGTSDNAYYKIGSESSNKGHLALVAAGVRYNLNEYTGDRESTSYFFSSNSAEFFSNEILRNGSYANYDIMASVIDNVTRTDRFADIELGGMSLNSPTSGGKRTVDMTLTENSKLNTDGTIKQMGLKKHAKIIYTVIVMLPSVTVLVLGVVMFVKRKFK